MSTQEDSYNVIRALNAFNDCIEKDGITINLVKFVKAYKELVK